MPDVRGLDIGFWFPRPERGARLAKELRHRGHRVTIYHHLAIPGDQSHVRHVGYHLLGGLGFLRRLSHEVLFTSRSFVPVLQLRLNKWLTGRPYVYTLNGAIWAYYPDRSALWSVSMAYPWLLRQALAGADAVGANSRFLANGLKVRIPESASKISTVYNGIDYDGIEEGRKLPEAWPPGETRVLSVVTINFQRKAAGVHLLIDAFNRVGEYLPEATYLIAAKSDNPQALEQVRAYLREQTFADRIKLEVNYRDVPSLLATADLFIYATPADSSDSLPRALLEAQAAGVPTVTTDTMGCGEAVLDGETGRVVPYDAAAVANAALELLQDRDQAFRLAATGKGSVRQRFNWDAMAEAYEELFLRVCGMTPESPVRA